nr:prisilkin-39-like [Coffea arabica]
MSSKKLLLSCISLPIVLMITSQVDARELAETSTSVSVDNSKTEEAKYPGGYGGYPGGGYGGYPGGGYGGYPGGGYGGYPGGGYGGYPGGRYGGYPGGGRGGYGGNCRFGCCGRNYYGGGCRCCYYPGQAVDAEPQN